MAGKKYGEVLGCQIIGHGATDMIAEVALGKTLEATTLQFGRTSHPYLLDDFRGDHGQAALAADGEAINF